MQPKNIKEFKELILRYESITLEDIENQLKYDDIHKAKTPQELKSAYKARAKHMRNIFKEYYNENNT